MTAEEARAWYAEQKHRVGVIHRAAETIYAEAQLIGHTKTRNDTVLGVVFLLNDLLPEHFKRQRRKYQ